MAGDAHINHLRKHLTENLKHKYSMNHRTKSARFLSLCGLIIGLAISSRLLEPIRSVAADSLTTFSPVAYLPVQTNMPNPLVAADCKTSRRQNSGRRIARR